MFPSHGLGPRLRDWDVRAEDVDGRGKPGQGFREGPYLDRRMRPYPWNFTYSKSPGLLSMPAGGGAIHEAKAPGSVTGRIRLATNASSSADGRNSWRRRCHSSTPRMLPWGSAWIAA